MTLHQIGHILMGTVLIINGTLCAWLSTRMEGHAKQGANILALPQLVGGLMLALGG